MPDLQPTPATITPALLKTHNITAEEYGKIEAALGRTPSLTEVGIFSVMWSEHCSYKSSRVHLKRLPTKSDLVIQGPGENAGIIDVGDGWACAFKIESHNHPSYIEPYQGAATGVGGILRDIFTMGARPLAVMDSLRFGPLQGDDPAIDYARNRRTMQGVVAGVGGYGNCFGVPNLGGETRFEPCYSGNPLVNAFALGLVRKDEIFYAKATGVGNPVLYVGAKTGRDGIHGATMASEEFTEGSEQKRPNVQMGDPFLEKLLLEACLEAMKTGAVLGIQDMGAAGLTCSTCEMGARGELGLTIELDKVPQRESGMSSYEIMLSESQERMLLVAERGREHEVLAVFEKWGLDCSEIGLVTADDVMRVTHHGELVAEIPNKALTDDAPLYHRPVGVWEPPVPKDPPAWVLEELKKPRDYTADLKKLLASPNICDKRWIFEQYDSMVQTNTVQGPGGEAGVMRIKGTGHPAMHTSPAHRSMMPGTVGFAPFASENDSIVVEAAKPERGLAMALAGNSRWCYLDPKLGAMHAVAEAARKVACTGARPVAATNCLNFGNPEKPEIMAQLSAAIDGIAEACSALGTPITGGNVSLYNETKGEGIYPTPVIGVVGILDDVTKAVPSAFQHLGDAICLLFPSSPSGGSTFDCETTIFDWTRTDTEQLREEVAQYERRVERRRWSLIGSSEYAKVFFEELWGAVPKIDLKASARCNEVLQELANLRLLHSAADEGTGGLARTVSQCCLPNNIGAEFEWFYEPPGPLGFVSLFQESSNVLITCAQGDVRHIERIAGKRGIGCQQFGITVPDVINIQFLDPPLTWSLDDLKNCYSTGLESQLAEEVLA